MTWIARNYPRRFGIPEQTVVYSQPQLFSLIQLYNGEQNCYLSINSYTDKEIVLEQIALDFDGEGAYQDVMNACKVLKELKVCHRVFFSGKKGFHLRIPVKSYRCGWQEAKSITRAVQVGIATGLKTADPHLIGDVRRILRIPNTMHIGSRLYCVEVPEGLAEKQIQQYAQKPHKLSNVAGKDVMSADELYNRFKDAGLVTVKHNNISELCSTQIQTKYEKGYVSDELIRKLFPQGCYRYYLRDRNPPHTIRVGSCIWLVYLGFDVQFLLQFYKDLAERFNWDDKDNNVRREKAIYDLVKRQYNPMSCGKIRDRGYCKKEVCEWMRL